MASRTAARRESRRQRYVDRAAHNEQRAEPEPLVAPGASCGPYKTRSHRHCEAIGHSRATRRFGTPTCVPCYLAAMMFRHLAASLLLVLLAALRRAWHHLACDRHHAARCRRSTFSLTRASDGAPRPRHGLSRQGRRPLFRLHALSGHLSGDAGQSVGRDPEAWAARRTTCACCSSRSIPNRDTPADPRGLCALLRAADRRACAARTTN